MIICPQFTHRHMILYHFHFILSSIVEISAFCTKNAGMQKTNLAFFIVIFASGTCKADVFTHSFDLLLLFADKCAIL